MSSLLNRRAFLIRSAAVGCSLAASPMFTPMSFAAAPWDNRLVVLILRGAMDGLDAVRPVGDADFAAIRPDRMNGGVVLNEQFQAHPELASLAPLWQAGEMGIVNAVSTPYRNKRSHFDGQDILEAGTIGTAGIHDGWLNRMLQTVPGVTAETTFAVGQTDMLVASGKAPVSSWSPDTTLKLSPQTEHLLTMVTRDDPVFGEALGQALVLAREETEQSDEAGMGSMDGAAPRTGYGRLAAFAAGKLKRNSRIATFSINGWDSHANQLQVIRQPMKALAEVISVLKQDLGPVWDRTAVIAMTEFGRTVRLNGTNGTDHGTAGTMIFAGGALRGGMAHGTWPGLTEADLYQRRDLMPTSDVRAQAATVMQGIFGLNRAVLEDSIFPGLDMSGAASLVV